MGEQELQSMRWDVVTLAEIWWAFVELASLAQAFTVFGGFLERACKVSHG